MGVEPVALLNVRPLQNSLPFGVRIRGIGRAQLGDQAVRAAITELFERHGMIVFEDIEPSNDTQIRLSNVFGPLKEHPVKSVRRVDRDGLPGVIELPTKPDSGGLVEFDGKQRAHWLPWHFDHCYNDELNRAGVLRATVIVEDGGMTGFTDGIALYQAFPRELLARIEGKDIIYRLDTQYASNRFGRPAGLQIIRPKEASADFMAQARAMPRAIHPAVWTRPTGEKVLHVSPYMAQGILGEETGAGYALFEEICQAINRVAAQCSYHHQWQSTEMVIWDNWRMLHSVSGHSPEKERVMQRTTIKGDYGLGRFENNGVGGAILENTLV